MKVQIEPELSEKPPLVELVNAANPVLETAIGRPAERVTAIWGFRSDAHGRPLIRLTLSDRTGEGSADFTPEELETPERAEWRFNRLWGDILQEASHRLLRKLLRNLETIGAGGKES